MSALKQAALDMKQYYDHHKAEPPRYKVGNQVWLNGKNFSTTRPMKKLDHKWYGPYHITKAVSDIAYTLKLPHQFSCVHPTSPYSNLTPRTPLPNNLNMNNLNLNSTKWR
jgi:hypothetical protein